MVRVLRAFHFHFLNFYHLNCPRGTQCPALCFWGLITGYSMVMIYLSINYTDKQGSPTVLVCRGPANKPVTPKNSALGFHEMSPTGSFLPLSPRGPHVLFRAGNPHYSWVPPAIAVKTSGCSRQGPGPRSQWAGLAAGASCASISYYQFPCLEFGGPAPTGYWKESDLTCDVDWGWGFWVF